MFLRLLPASPRAARPLNLFEDPYPASYPDRWLLPVETACGPVRVLALFNLSPATRVYTVTSTDVGLSSRNRIMALEWWSERWLGCYRDSLDVEVPAYDCCVLHLSPVCTRPSIVSTSQPISGPWVVHSPCFDADSGRLSGWLELKKGLRVVVFGHAPPRWRLTTSSSYHASANALGGWQAEVVTSGKRTAFEITFERSDSGG
jgi:hypothetical protein